ncbi:MAG: hypothetical protein E7439_03860 [Ruminococcaceae bacterium]|nr:hypothetical protein [Oscillospiraceae bacterium]
MKDGKIGRKEKYNEKRMLIFLAVVLAFMPLMSASANATEVTSAEPISSKPTVSANFTDDCVMLVMTNEASLSKLNYSASDFTEIDCKSVTNLSESKTKKVEMQLSGKIAEASSRSASTNALPSDFNVVNLESFNQILCLELNKTGKDKVLEAVALLEQRPDVLCAEPNYIYSIEEDVPELGSVGSEYMRSAELRSVTTNDTYAHNQWAIEKISLPDAWQIANGTNHKVTVGIIDAGIDADHPDLEGKVNTEKSRTVHEGAGVIHSVETQDQSGHGTMISGIIGAKTNNSIGISGINWDVELVSICMVPTGNKVTTLMLVNAINYAESQGIRLLSLSLNIDMEGGWDEPCTDEDEDGIVDPLDFCVHHCIENYSGLIICSAGNENKDIDNDNTRCPTWFDLPNIIVVGASTPADTRWVGSNGKGSNYGDNIVDLFAPGAIIYSTTTTDKCTSSECPALDTHIADGYHMGGGTSYAVPHVAGVASLIMSKFPNITISALRSRILQGVDHVDALVGKCVTAGRINAHKAVCVHYFGGEAEQVDQLYHSRTCSCGLKQYYRHTWVDIGGMEICSVCGYMAQ